MRIETLPGLETFQAEFDATVQVYKVCARECHDEGWKPGQKLEALWRAHAAMVDVVVKTIRETPERTGGILAMVRNMLPPDNSDAIRLSMDAYNFAMWRTFADFEGEVIKALATKPKVQGEDSLDEVVIATDATHAAATGRIGQKAAPPS